MILYKNKKNIVLSLLFILFFCECKKTEDPQSPEIYYISSKGGVISPGIAYDYEITIPANALSPNQYIKEKYNDDIPKLVLDSTFSFGAISHGVSFANYNCNVLQISGTIKLKILNNYSSYYNLSQTKPYCINNNQSILDLNNWQEINTYTKTTDNKIAFEFTDLNKTYFIGWRSN